MKELTVRFFIKTETGNIPLEEATPEQKKALGESILRKMGQVLTEGDGT